MAGEGDDDRKPGLIIAKHMKNDGSYVFGWCSGVGPFLIMYHRGARATKDALVVGQWYSFRLVALDKRDNQLVAFADEAVPIKAIWPASVKNVATVGRQAARVSKVPVLVGAVQKAAGVAVAWSPFFQRIGFEQLKFFNVKHVKTGAMLSLTIAHKLIDNDCRWAAVAIDDRLASKNDLEMQRMGVKKLIAEFSSFDASRELCWATGEGGEKICFGACDFDSQQQHDDGVEFRAGDRLLAWIGERSPMVAYHHAFYVQLLSSSLPMPSQASRQQHQQPSKDTASAGNETGQQKIFVPGLIVSKQQVKDGATLVYAWCVGVGRCKVLCANRARKAAMDALVVGRWCNFWVKPDRTWAGTMVAFADDAVPVESPWSSDLEVLTFERTGRQIIKLFSVPALVGAVQPSAGVAVAWSPFFQRIVFRHLTSFSRQDYVKTGAKLLLTIEFMNLVNDDSCCWTVVDIERRVAKTAALPVPMGIAMVTATFTSFDANKRLYWARGETGDRICFGARDIANQQLDGTVDFNSGDKIRLWIGQQRHPMVDSQRAFYVRSIKPFSLELKILFPSTKASDDLANQVAFPEVSSSGGMDEQKQQRQQKDQDQNMRTTSMPSLPLSPPSPIPKWKIVDNSGNTTTADKQTKLEEVGESLPSSSPLAPPKSLVIMKDQSTITDQQMTKTEEKEARTSEKLDDGKWWQQVLIDLEQYLANGRQLFTRIMKHRDVYGPIYERDPELIGDLATHFNAQMMKTEEKEAQTGELKDGKWWQLVVMDPEQYLANGHRLFARIMKT